MKNLILFGLLSLFLLQCSNVRKDIPYFLQASEPAQTSVILSARINASESLVNYDIEGVPAEVSFQIAEDTTGKIKHFGPMFAFQSHDFIARHKFEDLKPGTRYFYMISFILEGNIRGKSAWQSFRTLNPDDAVEEIRFVMVTGMNYHKFVNGINRGNRFVSPGDSTIGFPGYLTILSRKPDFFIGNGDNVYYDDVWETASKTPEKMRQHWHRLYHMKNFQSMIASTPVFWLKDDHDHRYNDSDTIQMNEKGNILLPTHQEGIKMFLEQAAFATVDDMPAIPYRTYSLNKDLQVWMVEGRDFRSPNKSPDGPDKSIWGKEQLDWLKTTLKGSEAKFRILVTPTPMVGPDDAYKIDNHTNPEGFRYERAQFVEWLKENNILGNGFYIICGDRHWQYHSLHPNGLEEFSCGALVDANSRLGRLPGDPKSTDPDGKVIQYYTQEEPSGGFLEVNCMYEDNKPYLRFRFFDENGIELYTADKLN